MPPDWKVLRKRTKKIQILNEPYFSIAEEYIALKETFEPLYVWVDMVLYPIYIVVQLCMQDYSVSYMFSLVKTYQLWFDWFRYKTIENKIDTWKAVVQAAGGPWISTNNPNLHAFVYADGMERIQYAKSLRGRRTIRSKKLTKCSK